MPLHLQRERGSLVPAASISDEDSFLHLIGCCLSPAVLLAAAPFDIQDYSTSIAPFLPLGMYHPPLQASRTNSPGMRATDSSARASTAPSSAGSVALAASSNWNLRSA